jgi:hypothetical protein
VTAYDAARILEDVAHMRRDTLLPGDYDLAAKDAEALARLLSLAERVAKAPAYIAGYVISGKTFYLTFDGKQHWGVDTADEATRFDCECTLRDRIAAHGLHAFHAPIVPMIAPAIGEQP